MGLAASQARLLGLTARKSNIEYQGQQINQARTALSNEVMGLYQKYNELEVPVAPSVYNYTETVYTIDSASEDYEITGFSKITSGQYAGYYNVSLLYDQAIGKKYNYTPNTNLTVERTPATGGGYDYSYINFVIGTETFTYDASDPEKSTIKKITEDYEQYPGLETIMKALKVTDGTFYQITTKDGKVCYTPQTDLDSTSYEKVDEKYHYDGLYTLYYEGVYKQKQSANAIAQLTTGRNGRLSSITVLESKDAPDLVGSTYSITTSTVQNEEKYEEAMNNYYYQKTLYEKEVEKINKETEKIQAEDKSLELKLNQLDTEQNAIATEMESVSKVIEDTIDSVFKTYNS